MSSKLQTHCRAVSIGCACEEQLSILDDWESKDRQGYKGLTKWKDLSLQMAARLCFERNAVSCVEGKEGAAVRSPVVWRGPQKIVKGSVVHRTKSTWVQRWQR